MKEESLVIKVCDVFIKYSIYILAFLVPIFFLPWTSDVLEFNKQGLLIFLIFISLFAWMLKTLVSGLFNIKINKIHIAVGILLLVYVLSAAFSVFRYGSIWGWPQPTAVSLLSVIGFIILYFLVSNNFSEKEIFNYLVLISFSSTIALVYGIFQIFGLYFIPFDFAKSRAFNTLGSIGGLGIFASSLLPFFIFFLIATKKWLKLLFILNTILSFIVILLINYNFIWWMTLLSSFLVIVFTFIKKDTFDGRWMFLPMFFMIMSVFFIVFSPQIKWLPSNQEIFLTHKANLEVSFNSIKSSPILGSGPGTFVYDFARYKSRDFDQSSFWNINFSQGSSKILTSLAEIGILGILSLLLLMFLPIFYGIKFLIYYKTKEKDVEKTLLISAILSILSVQTVGYFLYNSNMSLDFIYFFSIAAMSSLVSVDNKSYILKSSSLLNLAITFIFTAIFIFGLGFLMLSGQRYFANLNYQKASIALANNKKDDAINYLKIAASNNSELDFYFSQLSIYSLLKLQEEVSNFKGDITKDDDAKVIRNLVLDSVNAATIATNLNPKSSNNWSNKAYVCQNLVGLVGDAVNCAIGSYDKAIELNPNNPSLLLNQGGVYLAQALGLPEDKSQEKNDLLEKAKEKFDKAIEIKENYATAYLQKALIARAQKNKDSQIVELKNASKYSEGDAEMTLQIGLVYYQDKDWKNAEAEFQRSLSIVPNYANGLYYLGLTYDNQDKKENAISTFSKLLESNKDNEQLEKILDNLKSGKSALDGLVGQLLTPEPPSDSPENTQ